MEFLNLLETIESQIKSCLENQSITKLVQASLPNSLIMKNPCKYYTYEQLLNINKYAGNNELNLLHLNIRSLDKHLPELMTLIKITGDNYHFVTLSEIGKSKIKSRKAELKKKYGLALEYELPNSTKGGVGLIHDSKLKLIEREDIKIKSKVINNHKINVENIWYETDFPDKNDNYIIGVIYRHPGGTVECLNYFTQQLENILIKVNEENKKCIISGDLNIDGIKLDTNDNVKTFFNMTLEQTFIPTITIPTRITDSSVSLIDHILINSQIIKDKGDIMTGNLYCDISDHLPNFIKIKTKHNFNKTERPMVRIYGQKNMEKFRDFIANSSWEEYFITNDPDKALEIFYRIYNRAHEQAFPLIRLSRNRIKDKKWITEGLKTSIHNKNNLFRKFKFKPNIHTKTQYTKYKNILTKCIRAAENQYYINLIKSERQNLHTLWNIFGSIINPRKVKKDNKIKELFYKNKHLTKNQDISETFNEHFSTVGSKLAKDITNKLSHKEYLQKPNQNCFFLHPTDINETLKVIQNLKSKKSSGHDNISPKLLKANASVLTEPITYLINLSFKHGIVPEQLKIAKVIPIHKKNEKHLPDNYRPISLLSILNKITEKIMYKRLINFLNKHHILYDYQFGFRENHSTSLALIEIIDNIQKALENGKLVAGLFLDLSKAFDTVDHKILLDKLHHYGIRGLALQWFRNYLDNRKQFTHANGHSSSLKQVKYGVPQGSVLGPLLFLIYINDIANCTDSDCLNRLFADDANVFISRNTAKELKETMTRTLKKLFDWFKANKLTVNLTKTCYTIFKSKTKRTPDYLTNIKIGEIIIKRVKSAKYLGVILDENLDWKDHISEMNTSLIKIGNSFKIIRHQIPEHSKTLLYNAYIYSKIQYGIEVYGKAAASTIKKVQTQQNRAIKILYSKDYYTPTKILHKDLGIILVVDTYKLAILKFVFRHQNNLLPHIFENFFTENTSIHYHNTRKSKGLHVHHPNNKYGKDRTTYQGTLMWNSVSKNIRELKSIKTFNYKIKQTFLRSY